MPAELSTLEPDVRELVEQHLALVRLEPSSAKAHGELGLVYEANELWSPAEASYANAAILDPAEPLWRYHRSIALREAGRTVEANRLLQESANELPKAPGVQHRLGQVLLDLGDLSGAERAFQRALALAPDQPECLVGAASVHLAREDWAGARDLCLRAVKGDPDYSQAHYALGLAYRGLGDAKSAATAQALGAGAKARFLDDALSGQIREYRRNLMGQIAEATRLEQAHRLEEALGLWTRILARHPDDSVLMTNHAGALLGMGRVPEAIAELNRAVAIDEGSLAAHSRLAEAYLDAKQLEDALSHADRAVALGPQVAGAHKTRARVLAAGKRYDEAYSELRQAVLLDPRDAQGFLALSEVSLLGGRAGEAKGWCQQALDLDPSNLPARVNLVLLTLKSGDTEGARIQMKELVKIAPENPRVQALAAELGLPKR